MVVGSLRREAGGMSELLRNLGVLHCHGFAVDWEKVLGARAGRGWLRFRPMRFSGSAIGWRPRTRVG